MTGEGGSGGSSLFGLLKNRKRHRCGRHKNAIEPQRRKGRKGNAKKVLRLQHLALFAVLAVQIEAMGLSVAAGRPG